MKLIKYGFIGLLLLVLGVAFSSGCAGRQKSALVEGGASDNDQVEEELLSFSSPEEAVKVLLTSAASNELEDLRSVLGSRLVNYLSEVEDSTIDTRKRAIIALSKERITVETFQDEGSSKRGLIFFGEERFLFPVPLVQQGGRWRFDKENGFRELRARAIYQNEKDTILNLAKLRHAQNTYRRTDWDNDGVFEYASRVTGKKPGEGLYWPSNGGKAESILPLKAAQAEGNPSDHPSPIAGYVFKLLEEKSPNSASGYGVVAYPSRYGQSGKGSFLMNEKGHIYRADLGERTPERIERMTRFNPDSRWELYLTPIPKQ